MSIENRLFVQERPRRNAGVALVITLALLVLVAVVVVAFMVRSTTNQQITGGSSNGVVADAYSASATGAIVTGLQHEMWAGSVGMGAPTPTPAPPTIAGAPYIMPLTNNLVVNPSRKINATYLADPLPTATTPDAFAALVKQSLQGVPIYTVNSTDGPLYASTIPTTTPSTDGRLYDTTFWQQPQLIGSTATASALASLVPNWIYTDRTGKAVPTTAAAGTTGSGGTLTSTNVVGRYAYNIYDIGGNLNANLAGNALPTTTSGTTTSYPQQNPPMITTSPATEIVPGYRGSTFTADLSALSLYNGSPTQADWSQLPKWRANGLWPTNVTNLTGFAYLLSGGNSTGWLNDFFLPFDPKTGMVATGATPLTNNRFTSRQDLIAWVNYYWSNAKWVLPYLTHFSYDTDAPTFVPDPSRPTVKSQENDVATTGTNQDVINSPFVGTIPNFLPVTTIADASGNPLVKRRFPLSALSLIANCNPANPPSPTLASQIQYDFGLMWSATHTDPYTGQVSPCWVYTDADGNSGGILQLRLIKPTRSPNFFELLKAAITVGSLGKQYGNAYDAAEAFNVIGGRYAITANQIIQIGANIISQASTNYTPTHINFGGAEFYGVQDFPYLYRTRQLSYLIQQFPGTQMQITPPPTPVSNNPSNTNSSLEASVVQPELWNPHAPNAVGVTAGATYPTSFRVVPFQFTGSYANTASGGVAWTQDPGGFGLYVTNSTPAGGLNCEPLVRYPSLTNTDSNHPPTYLTVPAVPPSSGRLNLASFREPCALVNGSVPDGASFTGEMTTKISSFVAGDPTAAVDISSANPIANGVPSVFTTSSGSARQPVFGFRVGYFVGGPQNPGNFAQWLSIDEEFGGPMQLSLQYSIDGTNYYTYDVMDSAYPVPNAEHFNAFNYYMQWEQETRFDPRTYRWGCVGMRPAATFTDYAGNALQGQTGSSQALTQKLDSEINSNPQISTWYGSYTVPDSSYVPPRTAAQLGYSQVNQPPTGTVPAQQRGSNAAPSATYYADPDGVVRLADGAYTDGGSLGLPMLMGRTPIQGSTVAGPMADSDSRPVILNRPFQSVAELGYVFRDTPWRSLDFFTPQSGDNALLDVFTVYGPDPWSYANGAGGTSLNNPANSPTAFYNETGLVAGHVNLNTAQMPVLAALLQGTAVNTPTTNPSSLSPIITSQVAANIAEALTAWTHATGQDAVSMGPLRNRAELVGKYVPTVANYSGFSFGDLRSGKTQYQLSNLLQSLGTKAVAIKQQRECVMRALADVGTTRTWNLLIDLVAQTGHLTTNATNLGQFAATSEKHLWVSVAIDRLTGKVIKMQTEPVRM